MNTFILLIASLAASGGKTHPYQGELLAWDVTRAQLVIWRVDGNGRVVGQRDLTEDELDKALPNRRHIDEQMKRCLKST